MKKGFNGLEPVKHNENDAHNQQYVRKLMNIPAHKTMRLFNFTVEDLCQKLELRYGTDLSQRILK